MLIGDSQALLNCIEFLWLGSHFHFNTGRLLNIMKKNIFDFLLQHKKNKIQNSGREYTQFSVCVSKFPFSAPCVWWHPQGQIWRHWCQRFLVAFGSFCGWLSWVERNLAHTKPLLQPLITKRLYNCATAKVWLRTKKSQPLNWNKFLPPSSWYNGEKLCVKIFYFALMCSESTRQISNRDKASEF